MNRIYRLVFNRALGTMQVASELVNAPKGGATDGADAVSTPQLSTRLLTLAVCMALAAVTMPVMAQTCVPGPGFYCGKNGANGANGTGSGGGAGGQGGVTSGSYANAGGAGGFHSQGNPGQGAGGSAGSAGYSPGVGGGGGAGGSITQGAGGGGGGGDSAGVGAGGGGGGGAATYALIGNQGLAMGSGQTVIGGAGGKGGTGGSGAGGGGGGGGGAGIFASGSSSFLVTVTNSGGTISGGAGGAGGTGTTGLNAGSSGGGGAGVAGSYFRLINSGTVTGGAGSTGGGVGVISMGGSTITNSGTISGTGGDAIDLRGTGNTLELQSGSVITGNVVSNPNGSNTLQLDGSGTLTGAISGGNSGQYQGFSTYQKTGTGIWTLSNSVNIGETFSILGGGLVLSGNNSNLAGGVSMAAGTTLSVTSSSIQITGKAGSAGVVALGNSTITSGGTIAGGPSIGGTQADAIDLSAGGNTLVLEAGYAFTGNVVSTSGTTNGGDTLALGGSAGASFDVSQIGTTFQGFNQYVKEGTSIWTLTGAGNTNQNWTIADGVLQGDTSSVVGNVTFSPAVNGNPAFAFNQSTDGTYAGTISGSGTLIKLGVGALTLATQGSASQSWLIGQGSVIGNTTSIVGNVELLSFAGAIPNLTFDQSVDGTYAGTISGAGSVTKTGSGTLTLSGVMSANTKNTNVAWNIQDGEVSAQGVGSVYTGSFTLASGTSLVLGNKSLGNIAIAGVIGVAGSSGSTGTASSPTQPDGGNGTTGGTGGAGSNAVVMASGSSFSNYGAVLGGPGGIGGLGGPGAVGFTVPNGATVAGAGGAGGTGGVGGVGGAGVTGTLFTLTNTGVIDGGTGGIGGYGGLGAYGGTGGVDGNSGAGGAGGAAGLGGSAVSGGQFTVNNSGELTGGAGGVGGVGGGAYVGKDTNTGVAGNGGAGGAGGVGGIGGAAVSGTGFTLTNLTGGVVTGGAGGTGGAGYEGYRGGNANYSGGKAGATGVSGIGGNGGAGGSGVDGSGFTLTNAGAIKGGMGGTGGAGGQDKYANGAAGNGGTGGAGGAGVSGSQFTLTNTGSITGGNGGNGGSAGVVNSNATGGTSGAAGIGGAGGVGVSATGGATVINAGTIAGGKSATGVQADAVDFSGGGNTLVIEAAGTFTGNVVSSSGSTHGGDTLALGGSANASFNLSTVGSGAAFQGFSNFAKLGSSTWTLSGTGNASQSWTIGGGMLIGSSTSIAGNVAFAPASGGSAALTFNQASDGTFSGAISGNGSVTKTGTGTLIMDGVNTYTGGTTVAAGTLEVGDSAHANASLAGNVTVDAGGTLRGHGSIDGNVINNGIVWPGGSLGVLTINGNYTQNANATLQIDMTPTQASELDVTGTATLGGTLVLVYAPGTYTQNSYTLVSAKSITGTFANTVANGSVPTGAQVSLNYNTAQADLVLQSASTGSTPPTQVKVAPNDGSVYANLMRSENLIGQQSLATVVNATLRPADGGCGAGNAGHSNAISTSCNSGLWMQYSGSSNSLSGSNGMNSTAFGLQGGWDHALADVAHVGVEAGFDRINANDHLGGNGNIDNVHGGVYAFANTGPIVLSGVVDQSHSSYRVYRQTGIGHSVADPDGNTTAAALQAAWPMAAAQWQITPAVGALYQHQTLGGFGETVSSTSPLASAFPVNGARSTYNTLQPYAQVSFASAFVAQGVSYVPQFEVGYRYDTRNSNTPVVQETAQDGTVFAMPADSLGRGMATVGARITAKAGASWSLYLDYQGQFSSHLSDNALSVGFNKAF